MTDEWHLLLMDLKKGIVVFESYDGVKIKIEKKGDNNYDIEYTNINREYLKKIFSGFNAEIIDRLNKRDGWL